MYFSKILFMQIYQIYKIWFGFGFMAHNHISLFNAKSCLYIYIKYI